MSFKGHLSLVDCVAVSPDGGWLASGSKDRSVRIWDLKRKGVSESRNFADVQLGFAVSPKAEFLGVVNDDATMSIWDLIERRETSASRSRRAPRCLPHRQPERRSCSAIPSRKRSGCTESTRQNSDVPVEGAIARKAIATFSPDGKQFAVSGSEQLLRAGATEARCRFMY